MLGAKVLVSNLPYADELIIPSLKFDPDSPKDIAKKVKRACLDNEVKDTEFEFRKQITGSCKIGFDLMSYS